MNLSPAEVTVLEHLARGEPDKVIGRALGKSYLTVRDQVASARRKLGALNRTHLIALWLAQRTP